MYGHQKRYFIELQPDSAASSSLPRNQELKIRRELATQFIVMIAERLKTEELENKVSTLAVTALGQVQITCETDVINLIRDQDGAGIAAIRQGSLMVENRVRWQEAH
jgi:hypothetical protein